MPNRFFIVGAVTLAFLAQNAVAKDTDEDIKLREALRQKLAEADSTPGTAPAPAAAAPVITPPKVTTPAPPAPPALPVPPAPPVPPPPTVTAKPAAMPVMSSASSSPVAPVAEVAPVLQDDPNTAQLREALRSRMAQEGPLAEPAPVVSTPPAPKVKVPAVKEPTAKPVVTAKPPKATEPEYVPLVAPPTPLTGSKEQRLQQLLEQYKADQITPQEYHTQRAKIIAE